MPEAVTFILQTASDHYAFTCHVFTSWAMNDETSACFKQQTQYRFKKL
jgi:hypothetical protein